MTELWPLLLLGLVAWVWFENSRAREIASRAARETCQQQNLQLLDSTVVLKRVQIQRQPGGGFGLHRAYQFEYSENLADRQHGFVILSGGRVDSIGLAPSDQ